MEESRQNDKTKRCLAKRRKKKYFSKKKGKKVDGLKQLNKW